MPIDLSESKLLSLPPDILILTLLNLDYQSLAHVCQTYTKLRNICQNERLWYQKFLDLTGSINSTSGLLIPSILATTWFERVKLIWELLHPTKVYTLVQIFRNTNDNVYNVLATIKAKTDEEAHNVLANKFNNRISPLYEIFATYSHDIQVRGYPRAWGIGTETHNNYISSINKLANSDTDVTAGNIQLFLLYNDIDEFSLILSENSLISFSRDLSLIPTLSVYKRSIDTVLFTIVSTNINEIYAIFATLLNFSDIFKSKRQDYELAGEPFGYEDYTRKADSLVDMTTKIIRSISNKPLIYTETNVKEILGNYIILSGPKVLTM